MSLGKIELKDLPILQEGLIESLKKHLTPEIKRVIKDRVMSGFGEGDRPMLPYAPSTVAQRRAYGVQGGFRDLRKTGEMLDDLEVRETSSGWEVYFVSGESAQKAYYTNLQTPWLTLTRKDLEALAQAVFAMSLQNK